MDTVLGRAAKVKWTKPAWLRCETRSAATRSSLRLGTCKQGLAGQRAPSLRARPAPVARAWPVRPCTRAAQRGYAGRRCCLPNGSPFAPPASARLKTPLVVLSSTLDPSHKPVLSPPPLSRPSSPLGRRFPSPSRSTFFVCECVSRASLLAFVANVLQTPRLP